MATTMKIQRDQRGKVTEWTITNPTPAVRRYLDDVAAEGSTMAQVYADEHEIEVIAKGRRERQIAQRLDALTPRVELATARQIEYLEDLLAASDEPLIGDARERPEDLTSLTKTEASRLIDGLLSERRGTL